MPARIARPLSSLHDLAPCVLLEPRGKGAWASASRVPLASLKPVWENLRRATGLAGRNERAEQQQAIIAWAKQTDCITEVRLFGTGAY